MLIRKILALLSVLAVSLYANPAISTGSKTGTYIQIGNDIASTCKDMVELGVVESKGSLENYKRIVEDPNIKFVIVQYDVLQYMDQIGHKDAKNIKMVYPLYDEEIHIVAKKGLGITKLSDLNGKRVSIGKEGSGNWVTSSLLIEKGDLKVQTSNLDSKESLKAIINDEIDAMIYIAGVPASLFEQMPPNASELIEISNLNDPLLDELYKKSVIKADAYPFINKDINTYAIKSILATFDYKPGQPSYDRVEKIYKCLSSKLPGLKESGHPKWNQVSFDNYKEVNWDLHTAVKNNMGSDKSSNSGAQKGVKGQVLDILDNMN